MKTIFGKISISLMVALITSSANATIETVIGGVDLKQNSNVPGFLPKSSLPEIIISRNQYVISYNKEKRSPNWAAWKVEANQLGSTGRAGSFSRDTELEQYLQSSGGNFHAVQPSEYSNTCFDRGHVVPSGDRTDSPENNKPTFEMSNMIPQTPYLNRVMWEHLEKYTRDLVQTQNKKVYIIAGPIYDQTLGAIGPNHDIPVPSKEFKIILIKDAKSSARMKPKTSQVIAVIFPNVDSEGKVPAVQNNSQCPALAGGAQDLHDWEQYQTSVDEIEKLTGLSFGTAVAQ